MKSKFVFETMCEIEIFQNRIFFSGRKISIEEQFLENEEQNLLAALKTLFPIILDCPSFINILSSSRIPEGHFNEYLPN